MTAREIFIEETGHEKPSNPMLHAQWTLTFYDWLEKQVENGQKTKGNPESFEDTTLKELLSLMEYLKRSCYLQLYHDGSGEIVNNDNNYEVEFESLKELKELLVPSLSLGDKVTYKHREGTYVFLRYNKLDKGYVYISDGETERAVLIDHVTKIN